MRTKFDYDLVPLDNFGDMEDAQTVTVEVKFRKVVDNSYGADADGNRGVRVVTVEDITVKVLDDDKRDITNMVKTEYKEQYDEILEEAEHFALYEVEEGDL